MYSVRLRILLFKRNRSYSVPASSGPLPFDFLFAAVVPREEDVRARVVFVDGVLRLDLAAGFGAGALVSGGSEAS